MDNRTIILKEFEQLKGQFVITMSWKIERLVAIGTDDDDYYWVTYNGKRLTWSSCVGKIIPLKGVLQDDDYNEFERIADLNHHDRFILNGDEHTMNIETYKSELMLDYTGNDKLLTDIIFKDESKSNK